VQPKRLPTRRWSPSGGRKRNCGDACWFRPSVGSQSKLVWMWDCLYTLWRRGRLRPKAEPVS